MPKSVVFIDADEFVRLNRVDARMDALISCIDAYEDRANLSRNNCRPMPIFDLSTVKAIIGMVDE